MESTLESGAESTYTVLGPGVRKLILPRVRRNPDSGCGQRLRPQSETHCRTAFSRLESCEYSEDRESVGEKSSVCSMEAFVFAHKTNVSEVEDAFGCWLDQALGLAAGVNPVELFQSGNRNPASSAASVRMR